MISKKFYRRAASLGMALLLLIGTVPVTALADEAYTDTVNLSATVEVTVKGNSVSGTSGASRITPELTTFSVVLMPDEDDYPMPTSAKEENGTKIAHAVVDGAGVAHFDPIQFDQSGFFTYTVKQVAGEHQRYEYDATEYKISVQATYYRDVLDVKYFIKKVNGEEAGAEVGEEDNDGKADIMLFTNTYTEPEPEPVEENPEPEPTDKPDPDPDPNPNPNPNPNPDPDPTPTTTPSPSPSPSTSPTPTPSEEPTPTPSEEPTPTPTEEPTPSPEPSEKPEWRHDDEPIKVPADHEAPVLMDELPDPNDPDAPNFVTIIEDGVPLTFMKTEDPETGEMIYVLIEDEPVPEAYDPQYVDDTTNPDGSPKTGDETNNTPWIVLVCAAAAGLIGCALYLAVPRKRKH